MSLSAKWSKCTGSLSGMEWVCKKQGKEERSESVVSESVRETVNAY
mgnify:CR=1 FL=1